MGLKNLFQRKINYQKIESKAKTKNIAVRLIIFLISLLLLAIVFNLFLAPLNIVIGGSSGVAIILKEVFNIDVTITTYIIYGLTLILSIFLLPFEVTLSLVIATLVYPLCVQFTSNITDIISLNYSNPLVICIFAGLLNGIGTGTILKVGFNSGGLIVIPNILYNRFKISISKSNLIMSTIIILIGGYYFGISNIMYAIIVIYISTIFTDKVMLGISDNKVFFIVTSKEKEVKKFVTNYLTSGVTIVDSDHEDKVTLMCAIPTSKYFIFKEGIATIDASAFWYATDSYQVMGQFRGGK